MKLLLLAGTAFLGLAALGSGARATLFDFTYSGSLVNFTIPTTDSYQILAFGAQGGSATLCGDLGCVTGSGGLGAEIGGDFLLTAGENLQIAVGGVGSDTSPGGGGGGSFVVGPGNMPLVIAGGGGGGGGSGFDQPGFPTPLPGQGGLTGPDGGNGGNAGGMGGTGGNGGGGGGDFLGGGGGGGFLSAGGGGGGFSNGGGAFPDLTAGDIGGGFGGFGGGGGSLAPGVPGSGAGGGGGYSGGGGGGRLFNTSGPGGGGGSFDAGIDQILVADFRTGNGEVLITELVPEPASSALLGAGLRSLAAVWRRRRGKPT